MWVKKKPPAQPVNPDDYAARLESAKRQSTVQLLFKVARLLDEKAIARVAARHHAPVLRRSHTSLLPHIDLEGTRITDLAERLGVTKQAVSQLVDDLEKLGMLARTPDPDDARARRVAFTARGRQGLLEGLQVLRDLEDELARQIGKKRMEGLRDALLAAHDQLDRPKAPVPGD
jgi:DNA-binding MarR family transcriptional regulator